MLDRHAVTENKRCIKAKLPTKIMARIMLNSHWSRGLRRPQRWLEEFESSEIQPAQVPSV